MEELTALITPFRGEKEERSAVSSTTVNKFATNADDSTMSLITAAGVTVSCTRNGPYVDAALTSCSTTSATSSASVSPSPPHFRMRSGPRRALAIISTSGLHPFSVSVGSAMVAFAAARRTVTISVIDSSASFFSMFFRRSAVSVMSNMPRRRVNHAHAAAFAFFKIATICFPADRSSPDTPALMDAAEGSASFSTCSKRCGRPTSTSASVITTLASLRRPCFRTPTDAPAARKLSLSSGTHLPQSVFARLCRLLTTIMGAWSTDVTVH